MQYEYDEIKNGLFYFTYFSKLNEAEIQEGCSIGKIKSYTPHETILGDGIGLFNFAYFVLSGQCCLIETLNLTDSKMNKICNDSVKNCDNLTVNGESSAVKPHFMQVCLINTGGCFNFEQLGSNRRIISVNRVKCMLLPKHWLWQKNNSNIWGRVKHFLEKKIPTTEEVHKQFQINRSWEKYKIGIVKEIVSHRKAKNYTTIHDVPFSIKMNKSLL